MASRATGLSLAALRTFMKESKGFEKCIEKLNVTALGHGKCTAELKVSQEHTNAMGGLHGGLSATLVDCVSTWALMSEEKNAVATVSVDIHMTYLKAAKLDDEIVVEADTVKAGKTLAFLAVEIKNKASGEVLVKGSHTKFMMR